MHNRQPRDGGVETAIHIQMTGTAAGARRSSWHTYLKECAKAYRERQKAGSAAKDDPHSIRRERAEKERTATKRRLKGEPVHDASHRIKEADAGKAGKPRGRAAVRPKN